MKDILGREVQLRDEVAHITISRSSFQLTKGIVVEIKEGDGIKMQWTEYWSGGPKVKVNPRWYSRILLVKRAKVCTACGE